MLNENRLDQMPSGVQLRCILRGHKRGINWIAWSPDGRLLATSSNDRTIKVWETQKGDLRQTFDLYRTFEGTKGLPRCVEWSPNENLLACCGIFGILVWNVETRTLLLEVQFRPLSVNSITWSPDGERLAFGNDDGSVQILDVKTKTVHRLGWHRAHFAVNSIAWSPNRNILASGSKGRLKIWDIEAGEAIQTFRVSGTTNSIAWSPDGTLLALGSSDASLQLWYPNEGWRKEILEGHTGSVTGLSFCTNRDLLVSKSLDGTIRFWHSDFSPRYPWETVAILNEPSTADMKNRGLASHTLLSTLATLDTDEASVRVWDLNTDKILAPTSITSSVRYTNAKVVLVGDSGVGKSGLALVLTGQPFTPTDSTHGRHIWTLGNTEVSLWGSRKENREIFLWDLAGQPGYRLIHQLHLNEVSIALIVFDARSETDPFAGVYHWDRALRLAQRVQDNSLIKVKKFLVAARIDRGGKGVSQDRLASLLVDLNFDDYFETSAKEGIGISELVEAIIESLDWKALPKVSSTELFSRIRAFIIGEKTAGRILSTRDDLYRTFLATEKVPPEMKVLRAPFEVCISRIESRGLIRRLSFGNLVLLQPELLDSYASALINAVKDEPDGLGSIAEEKAKLGDFNIFSQDRLKDREQERLLLIAMVEDLLRHEIALRETASDGQYLIFPSQSTRENPDLPDPEGKTVIFDFEGPVLNIYTTLVVRLSHSEVFKKKELWRNAVIYTTKIGGACGVFLRNVGEGRGELTVFFEKSVGKDTRAHFEEYVYSHLQRKALPESIRQKRVLICPGCETPLSDLQVVRRRELGFDWMRCGVCETVVSLNDEKVTFEDVNQSFVQEMDIAANNQRDLATAALVLHGKKATNDFDVFLSYNRGDKVEVIKIGERLKERGILPWLDEWELQPGKPWQRVLEEQIENIKSAAVFIGRRGVGPWHRQELEAFLREFVRRGCPVIPVLLPNSSLQEEKLPLFLRGMSWVDFRDQESDPLEDLIWGITGKRGV
jgi:WD40 repeat protein